MTETVTEISAPRAVPESAAVRSALFQPLRLREVVARNRVWMAPMCQYSARPDTGRDRGMPNEWHLVHLGSRAVGGAGMVIVEATGVSPEGRISPYDLGLWSERHAEAFRPITRFLDDHGAVPAVQLAHAGRKASTGLPWAGGGPVRPSAGGWRTLGPSAVEYPGLPVPDEMTAADIDRFLGDLATATRYALRAGFRAVELHAAHGYLLHQFLSPLSNRRADGYGGSPENRMRLTLEAVDAVRSQWPDDLPLLVRLSATDWAEGGWDVEDTVDLARRLAGRGVDLVDVSTGGNVPAHIPVGPHYQVGFAERVRQDARIPTAAVGLITEPAAAEAVVADGQADVVLLGRELLRDPYWPLRAAAALGAEAPVPPQYARAFR